MAKTVDSEVRILGRDLTGKAFASAGAGMAKLAASMRALNTSMPRLHGGFNLMSGALRTMARMASAALSALTSLTGIAVIGSVGGLAAALKITSDRLGDLANMSDKIGIPVQKLREFQAVAEAQGVAWESASSGLVAASKNYADIRKHQGKVYTNLSKTNGLLEKQIETAHSAGEAFDVMMGAVASAKDEAEAIRLSQLFFGTDDFAQVAKLKGQELQDFLAAARKHLGYISQENAKAVRSFGDSIGEIRNSITGYADDLATKILPQFTGMNTTFAQFLDNQRDWVDLAIAEKFRQMVDYLKGVDWAKVGESLRIMGEAAGKLAAGIRDFIIDLGKIPAEAAPIIDLFNKIDGYFKAWDSFWRERGGISGMIMNNWQKVKPAIDAARKEAGLPEHGVSPGTAAGLFGGVASGMPQGPTMGVNPWERRPGIGGRYYQRHLGPQAVPGRAPGRQMSSPWGLYGEFRDAAQKAWWANRERQERERLRQGTPGDPYMGPGGSMRPGGSDPLIQLPAKTDKLSDRMTSLTREVSYLTDVLRGGGSGGASLLGHGGNDMLGDGLGGGLGGFSGGPGSFGGPSAGSPAGGARAAAGGPMGGGSAGGGSYSGGPGGRASQMMNFLMKGTKEGGLGFSAAQARGVVAGMMGESGAGLNPGAIGDKGTSGGIAQWHNERLTGLKRFAAAQGKPWNDFGVQQQYLQHELQGREGGALSAVRGAGTDQEALAAWVHNFERSKHQNADIRKRSGFLPGLRQGQATEAQLATGPSGMGMGESAKLIASRASGGALRKGAISGMQPQMQQRLAAWMAENPGLGIYSGYRSKAKQMELLRKDGGTGMVGGLGSRHIRGQAGDMMFNGHRMTAKDRARLEASAQQHGLWFPLKGQQGRPNEPWHVEMMGSRADSPKFIQREQAVADMLQGKNGQGGHLGKGELTVKIKPAAGTDVVGVQNKPMDRVTTNVGVDRTGDRLYKPGLGAGMLGHV